MPLAAPTLGSEQNDTGSPFTSGSWTPASDDLILTFATPRGGSAVSDYTWTGPTDDDANAYTEVLTSGLFFWQGGSDFAAETQIARTIVDDTPAATETTYGVTPSGGSLSRVLSHVVRVAGHDPTAPILSSGSSGGDPNGGTIPACNVGALVTGSLVICSVFAGKGSAPALSAPTLGGQPMTQLGTQIGDSFNYQECWFRVVDGTETDGEIDVSDWDFSRNAIISAVQVAEAAASASVELGAISQDTDHSGTDLTGTVTTTADHDAILATLVVGWSDGGVSPDANPTLVVGGVTATELRRYSGGENFGESSEIYHFWIPQASLPAAGALAWTLTWDSSDSSVPTETNATLVVRGAANVDQTAPATFAENSVTGGFTTDPVSASLAAATAGDAVLIGYAHNSNGGRTVSMTTDDATAVTIDNDTGDAAENSPRGQTAVGSLVLAADDTSLLITCTPVGGTVYARAMSAMLVNAAAGGAGTTAVGVSSVVSADTNAVVGDSLDVVADTEVLATPTGVGDLVLLRNSADASPLPSGLSTLTYDETVKSVGSSISYSAGVFTLNEAGKYLVLYSEHIGSTDTTNNTRFAWGTWIRHNASDAPYHGWDTGYLRKQSGSQDEITAGAAIIDAAAGDEIRITAHRFGSYAANDTATTRIADDRSGVVIVRLDATLNFARYTGTPTTTSITDGADTPMNLTAVEESGPFTLAGNSIDIATDRVVLAIYSLRSDDDPGNRAEYLGRFTLAGSDVASSWDQTYVRSYATNDVYGGMSSICLLEPTSGDDLQIVVRSEEQGGSDYSALVDLVELPAAAKAVIVEATTGDLNAVADFEWDTAPRVDADTFTHAAGTTPIQIDAAGDYLVGASLQHTAGAAVARAVPAIGFRVNNVENDTFGASSYHRNSGSAHNAGMAVGGLLPDLLALDEVELYCNRLGTASGTIPVAHGGMFVLSLDSIMPAATGPTAVGVSASIAADTSALAADSLDVAADVTTNAETALDVAVNVSGTATVSVAIQAHTAALVNRQTQVRHDVAVAAGTAAAIAAHTAELIARSASIVADVAELTGTNTAVAADTAAAAGQTIDVAGHVLETVGTAASIVADTESVTSARVTLAVAADVEARAGIGLVVLTNTSDAVGVQADVVVDVAETAAVGTSLTVVTSASSTAARSLDVDTNVSVPVGISHEITVETSTRTDRSVVVRSEVSTAVRRTAPVSAEVSESAALDGLVIIDVSELVGQNGELIADVSTLVGTAGTFGYERTADRYVIAVAVLDRPAEAVAVADRPVDALAVIDRPGSGFAL